MAKDEIVDKLADFMDSHVPLTEEAHVTYLLVEVRKIIDQTGAALTYPLLKFYADWAVHSRKDKITPEFGKIAEELYQSIVSEITSPYGKPGNERPPVIAFAYMDELAKEFEVFFSSHSLRNTLTGDKTNWVSFVSLLVKVLENQPIVAPSKNIKRILFQPTSVSFLVVCIVEFEQPVKGLDGTEYQYYELKNVYA